MPLIDQRKLSENSLTGIWEVTESEAGLLEIYPCSEAELKKLSTYSHPFRRTQFLASRALLHSLLPGTKIVYDENGKPFPHSDKKHISISHSGNLIAIMTDEVNCGIDIEFIRPKIERIAPKFLSDEELKNMVQTEIVERMHVYWCVKEATYKVYGRKNVSLKSDIFVEKVTDPVSGSVNVSLSSKEISFNRIVHYKKFNDYMLAWTGNSGR